LRIASRSFALRAACSSISALRASSSAAAHATRCPTDTPLSRSSMLMTRKMSIGRLTRAALYSRARASMCAFAASAWSVGSPVPCSPHVPVFSRQNRTRAVSRSARSRRFLAPSGSTVITVSCPAFSGQAICG